MKKLLCLLTIVLGCERGFAQLPQCSNIYTDKFTLEYFGIPGLPLFPIGFQSGTEIYGLNPLNPVGGGNPVVNTIALPANANGLAICPVLGSGNPTETFYTLVENPAGVYRYHYYNPATNAWVNTGHNPGPAAVNIAGGGGFLYALQGATGNVYKYDGTGNATLLITVPGMANEGPWDLIADCEGDWYVLNLTGVNTPPFLRKYSPAGVLLESWTVNNPNGYNASGGFGIINNTLYVDAVDFTTGEVAVASGTITPGSITINTVSAPLPFTGSVPTSGFTFDMTVIGDLGSCAGAIPIVATIAISANPDALCAGTSVTYTSAITGGGTNPQYQWFVNGEPVPGATGPTFTHVTNMNEQITCQLTSSSLCVPEKIVMSAPAVIDVVDGSTPVLSYAIDKICEGEHIQIEPVAFTPKAGTFSVSPATGLNVNTTTGAIDFSGAAVGNYTITYTTKGNRNCPSKTATANMEVLAKPFVAINQMDDITSLCEGAEIRLAATDYPNATYYWWPQQYFDNNFFESKVTGKFPEGITTVSVFVKDENGCVAKDTTTVQLAPCCKFDMPNAFTPNGDGRNDYFAPASVTDLAITNFSIFNRWGQLVYNGFGSGVNWDGKLKGKDLAQGVYSYIIEFRCNGELFSKKGDVMLMR